MVNLRVVTVLLLAPKLSAVRRIVVDQERHGWPQIALLRQGLLDTTVIIIPLNMNRGVPFVSAVTEHVAVLPPCSTATISASLRAPTT